MLTTPGSGLLVAIAPPGTRPEGDVLAVSASAVQGLLDLGVAPHVVDDVVDRSAVLGPDDAYIRWQSGWFERLDDAVGARGAVLASAQKLKPVVDSLVIATRLADAVIARLDPASVVVLSTAAEEPADPLHDGHLQFWPRLGDPPLWASILPLIGEHRGVAVTVRSMDVGPARPAGTPRVRDRARALAAQRTGMLRHFDLAHWRPGSGAGTTLVTWPGGYGARNIVARERSAGRRVVTLHRGSDTTSVFEPVPWGRRTLAGPVSVSVQHRPNADLAPLLAELDDRAGVPGTSRLIESRLDAFVQRIVPAVVSAAERLEPELDRLGVDKVVTANPSSVEEFATLLAAGRLGIERQLAQHGDHLFSYDGWFVSELWNIDTLLASDSTLEHDIPEAAVRLGARSPRVLASAHRDAAAEPADHTGPVCYVPGVLMGDTAIRPSLYFDDAWYHRWHLRVLDWMASRPGTQFVWKALPSGDHAEDPIADAVHGTPNVEYVSQPLPWVLGKVSRVFTDFPSTPAYEARRAGLPLLVLWFPRFSELRPRAVADFGAAVRSCPDETAAIGQLSDWLDGPS